MAGAEILCGGGRDARAPRKTAGVCVCSSVHYLDVVFFFGVTSINIKILGETLTHFSLHTFFVHSGECERKSRIQAIKQETSYCCTVLLEY